MQLVAIPQLQTCVGRGRASKIEKEKEEEEEGEDQNLASRRRFKGHSPARMAEQITCVGVGGAEV